MPQPAPVIRLGHVALRTADLEAMTRHYTEVLGLWECQRDGDGRVHLTCGGVGADVELIPSDAARLDHVSYDLAPGIDRDAVLSQLSSLGLTGHAWERGDPGAVAAFGIEDCEGNSLQLTVPEETLADVSDGPGIRPRKLGHVATRVRDSAAIRAFYEDKLGFRFSDANDRGLVFLRCNADHHAANFIEASNPGQLHHVAFELEDDFTHVQRAGDRLREYGIPIIWGPGRHGPGHNIFTYHRDPDGNIVELFTQLDRMSDERQGYFDPRSWHERRPQRPKVWTAADRKQGGMDPPRPEGFFA